MKILAMTVFCVDIYLHQNTECIGGNSLNFATQCIRSGIIDVAVIGAVGNDRFGVKVKEHLAKYNINSAHLYTQEGRTASNKIYITEAGERTFLPDSWDGGVYQTFRLSDDDWNYMRAHDIVAIPCLDPNFSETLKQITPSNKLVVDFLDTRDFDRMEEVLPKLDIAFISGDNDVVERLKPMSEKVDSLVVVTLGAEGSITLQRGKSYFQKAVAVESVVDTTGCGDSYQAAFTISWFENKDIQKAMSQGALAASKVLGHFGGV